MPRRRSATRSAAQLLDDAGGASLLVRVGDEARRVTVYLVGAGPGDPGLLTRRGAELLARPTSSCYDRLGTRRSLELAPPDAERIYVGQGAGRGRARPRTRSTRCSSTAGAAGRDGRAAQGRRPVRVRPGRRGGRGARRRRRPVRGRARDHQRDRRARVRRASRSPTAACRPTSPSSPATRTRQGRAPTSTGTRSPAVGGTLVILMGAGRIARHRGRLIDGRARPPDTPVAAVRNGTRPDQRTIARHARHASPTPASRRPPPIVVGAVAALDLAWFEPRPLFGRAVVVTRAREQASELRARLEIARRRGRRAAGDRDRAGRVRGSRARRATTWLVFTSANGVAAFFDRGLAPAGLDARALGGRARRRDRPGNRGRARRARRASPTSCPSASSPSRCSTRSRRRRHRARPCCSPRAEQARDVLPDGLGSAGYAVDVLPVYRTVAAPRRSRRARTRPARRRRRDHVHVVVDGHELLSTSSAICPTRSRWWRPIGPVTSRAARRPRPPRRRRGRRAHHRRPRRRARQCAYSLTEPARPDRYD